MTANRPLKKGTGPERTREDPATNPGREAPVSLFQRAAAADAKRHAAQIARRLAKHYPEAACSLHFQSPLELLVATILSAQCTDVRVNVVTKDLFRKYRAAADYARAALPELEATSKAPASSTTRRRASRAAAASFWSSTDGQVPQRHRPTRGVARHRAEDGQRRVGHRLRHRRRRGGRYARRPHQPPARADEPKGSSEDRTGLDGAVRREGLDRLESPPDPSWPPLLHGPQAKV